MFPPYRHDLEIEADIIEEVARMFGYNNIPETLPAITEAVNQTAETRNETARSYGFMRFQRNHDLCFHPANIDESFKEKKPLLPAEPTV